MFRAMDTASLIYHLTRGELFVTLFVCIVWLGTFLYFGERQNKKDDVT